VTQKFDFIDFGREHCKITELRPIDYKAMLKSGEGQPKTEKSAEAATRS
jgi:hypothetical protein